jgi:predicted ribosome quality control (RQC) complex YloA/Tae2 family protein
VKSLPFDGIVTKAVSDELNRTIAGGRIFKIYQPSRDTIIFHIRAGSVNYKLLLSCNANSARVHLTDTEFENPINPPMFCMLLRKHLSGGTVLNIEFMNFERILRFHVEVTDELGDKSEKQLVIEIMGRHSNIILLNSSGVIIDSVKHVDHYINRFREIMPARHYILPPAQDKANPFEIDYDKFVGSIRNEEKGLAKILLSSILGFRSGIMP